MPIPSLTREQTGYFTDRIIDLTPESERRFGQMDAVRMLRHMRLALGASVEGAKAPERHIPSPRNILFYLTCHLMTTWPGGRIKVSDSFTPPPEHDFDEERHLMLESLLQFIDALEQKPDLVARHPIFGPLNLEQWARFNGVHLNHHLRQFGV